MTDSRALLSHIAELERQIDRTIPSSSGFVVYLKSTHPAKEIIKTYAHNIIERDEAIMAYTFCDNLILVFFANDKRKEISIFKILSKYISEMTKLLCMKGIDANIHGKVLIVESKLLIFSYIHTIMFENSKEEIARLLGNITKGTISRYTFKEIVSKLKDKGIDWSKISHSDKFGLIIRPRGVEKEILLNFSNSDEQMEDMFD